MVFGRKLREQILRPGTTCEEQPIIDQAVVEHLLTDIEQPAEIHESTAQLDQLSSLNNQAAGFLIQVSEWLMHSETVACMMKHIRFCSFAASPKVHLVTAPFSVPTSFVDTAMDILRAADTDLCLQETHKPVKLHGHITHDHSQLMIFTCVNKTDCFGKARLVPHVPSSS